MINLFNLVKDQLSDNVVGQVAKLVGGSSSATNTAIGAILPKLMGGIIDKGSSTSGAESLLNTIKSGNLGGGMLDNLAGSLGGGDKSNSFLQSGGKLVSSIFGNKSNSMLDSLGSLTGMGKSSNSSLMNILTPIAMSVIGKQVTKSNLDANGLKDMLMGQRTYVSGNASKAENVRSTATKAEATTRTAAKEVETSGGGGLGILKLALPLLLLGGLGWYFMQGSGDTTTGATKEATTTVNDHAGHDHTKGDHSGHDHAKGDHSGHDHAKGDHSGHSHGTTTTTGAAATGGATYKIVEGNLTDANGNIIAKAGEFTKDQKGNYLSKSGEVLNPLKGAGEKLKDGVKGTGGKLKGAVEGAGDKVKGAGGKLKGALKGAGDKIKSSAEAAGQEIKGAAEGAGDKIKGAANKLKDGGK